MESSDGMRCLSPALDLHEDTCSIPKSFPRYNLFNHQPGQEFPLSSAVGEAVHYAARHRGLPTTDELHAMGPADQPPSPRLSLIGDFGGGGLLGAFGILAAVFAARTTGKGSIVDAAMVDGTILLMALTYRRVAALLRDAGWQVNDKRVERLWRREGLKVPMKQSKKGRL